MSDMPRMPHVDFLNWWNSQDTINLSDACKWSAWNAWEYRERELAAANEAREKALAWTDEDKPLPEDAEIHAHHPIVNGSHKTYEEALRVVGAKRSKGALVDLVNWLLQRNNRASNS